MCRRWGPHRRRPRRPVAGVGGASRARRRGGVAGARPGSRGEWAPAQGNGVAGGGEPRQLLQRRQGVEAGREGGRERHEVPPLVGGRGAGRGWRRLPVPGGGAQAVPGRPVPEVEESHGQVRALRGERLHGPGQGGEGRRVAEDKPRRLPADAGGHRPDPGAAAAPQALQGPPGGAGPELLGLLPGGQPRAAGELRPPRAEGARPRARPGRANAAGPGVPSGSPGGRRSTSQVQGATRSVLRPRHE
mmetsp:Transcript_3488/g.9946  ORF Transcript_3488/g.9946 Transcript_3488/m.9946 type:complete len:246 (-) Transcript_3488:78-815(-)